MKRLLSSLLLCAVLAFGSVEFDGTDDHMNCGSAADIDDLSQFTISAWVKIHSIPVVHDYILGKINSSQHRGWSFYGIHDPTNTPSVTYAFRVLVEAGSSYVNWTWRTTADNSLQLDTWQHVVATWNGGQTASTAIKIYINGSEATYHSDSSAHHDGSGSYNSDAGLDLYFGSRDTASKFVDGEMACLAIWEDVATLNDVKTLAAGPCRAVHRTSMGQPLRFFPTVQGREGDTLSGTDRIKDKSGNAGHCTPANTPLFRAAPIPF